MASVLHDGSSISGFYYDLQKRNRMMCVSLHPNRTTLDGVNWDDVTKGDVSEYEDTFYADSGDSEGYRWRPLCTSILTEDFNVGVVNSFSSTGADPIGALFNQFKPLAPYAKKLGEYIKDAKKSAETESKNWTGKISKAIYNMGDTLSQFNIDGLPGKVSDYLNRSLLCRGARFSYYNGTENTFGNLTMKFTVFSDYCPVYLVKKTPERDTEGKEYFKYELIHKVGEFSSVYDLLEELRYYCFGPYLPATDVDQLFSDKLKVSEYVGWQMPPGGLETDYDDLTDDYKSLRGTLKLKIGPYFSMKNLVIELSQFTFSKLMIKVPAYFKEGSINITKDAIVPLYCDVMLSLKPMTKYTTNSLWELLKGQGQDKDRELLSKKISENLQSSSDSCKTLSETVKFNNNKK